MAMSSDTEWSDLPCPVDGRQLVYQRKCCLLGATPAIVGTIAATSGDRQMDGGRAATDPET
jgi:hypothetical protein